MLREIGSLLIVMSFQFYVSGQSTVYGRLIDAEGVAIPFANVVVHDPDDSFVAGELADENGNFTIPNLEKGICSLYISSIGYASKTIPIDIQEEQFDLDNIVLDQQGITLDQLTISGQKVPFSRKVDRTIINVSSLPTAAGSNILELLEKSPTVRAERVTNQLTLMGRTNVKVFVNGKQIRLEGADLFQYLSSIPSNQVESLELIHNPPASYDAEGTGGVIDITLKRSDSKGFNGQFSINAGYGERPKYGGAVLFNYGLDAINIYGDASTNQDYTFQNSRILSDIQFDAGVLQSDQFSYRPAYIANYSSKLGVTFDITEASSLDIFGSFARRHWALDHSKTETFYTGSISPFPIDVLEGCELNQTDQSNFSFHTSHKITNATSLSFDYDYINFDIENPTDYIWQQFNKENELQNESSFHTMKETPFDFHVFKMDISSEVFENWEIEVGAKASVAEILNSMTLSNNGADPILENLFSDQTHLEEKIYAGYLTFEGSLTTKYTISGGVRYEDYDLILVNGLEGVQRRISRPFPTFTISRQIGENIALNLSYRERISRPGFQDLAPAFFFLNPNTLLTGNIQILPNLNRTLECSFTKGAWFSKVYFSHDNAPIAGIPQRNQESSLLLLLGANFEDRKQYGFSLGFPYSFTSFWESRYSIDGFWRRDELKVEKEIMTLSNPFVSIDISQIFSLKKDWSLEASGRYISNGYAGTLFFPQRASLHLGVQKKWKNASLGFSWTDVFNSSSFFSIVNDLSDAGIYYEWFYDLEGSIAKLSYTYTLGNEAKKGRTSVAADVFNRMD